MSWSRNGTWFLVILPLLTAIQLYISTLMVDCRGLLVFTVYQVSWFMAM